MEIFIVSDECLTSLSMEHEWIQLIRSRIIRTGRIVQNIW